jgi:hypothetical protein
LVDEANCSWDSGLIGGGSEGGNGGGDWDGGTDWLGAGEGDEEDACCCSFEFCAKAYCVESLVPNSKLAIMAKDINPKKNTKPIFEIPVDICTQLF